MAIINKNIWSLFYLVFGIGLISFVLLLYSLYNNTHEEFQQEQENIVKMTANSTNSVFLQYEMILDILGNQLMQDNSYKSLVNSQVILDNLTKLNPSVLGFSLVKPNGQEYITNSNINVENLPNLLKKKDTRDTFLYTLEKSKMIIGRTYFANQFDTFIVPIRKAIRDKNNKIIAVMTAGIDLEKGFDFFIKNKKNDLLHETFIFRNFDNYFQIAQKINLSNTKIYDYQIPKNLVDSALQRVSNKYHLSPEEIKDQQIVTTIESDDRKRNVIASSVYIKKYELWITSQFPLDLMYNTIYKKASILVFIFLSVNILIYYLFKYINNYERKKQEVLYYQATHDYLTNLHNRLYLSKKYNFIDKKNAFTLLFIDMDNFKNINDNYGHSYGDKILIEISTRLKSFKNGNDELIRFSGDEFVLITSCCDLKEIRNFTNSILKELSQPYIINQYKFILGASIGISQFPNDGKDFDEVKRYADIAMYEAKKIKNSYCIFDTTIKESFFQTSLIENELKTSLTNNEIYMVYQPQVKTDGTLYGVEALIRWENDTLGFVPPDEFISIAEDMGFMGKLGKFIIEKSLKEIQELQKITNTRFQLSINISVKQFMEMNFYENILESIKRNNFDNLSLTLEVTENVFIDDIEFILNLLSSLKKQGVKISLDDFGTGYSSLSLLKKLPIDELKIDKSFVDDIVVEEEARAMVENIITIGKRLNMVVLAEGIESIEQKDLLTLYGCDLFQGYYFSKPLKLNHLNTYVQNNVKDL